MLKDNKSIWSMLKQPNKTGNSNNKKTSGTKKKPLKIMKNEQPTASTTISTVIDRYLFHFHSFFLLFNIATNRKKKNLSISIRSETKQKKIAKQKEIYQRKQNNNKLIRITGQTNLKPEKPKKKSQIFK